MNDQTTDLTDAQVLRWLHKEAERLAKELGGPELSLHLHAHAVRPWPESITVRIISQDDHYIGQSIAEAVAEYRAAKSPGTLLSMAALKRAEADRLEREAEAAKLGSESK